MTRTLLSLLQAAFVVALATALKLAGARWLPDDAERDARIIKASRRQLLRAVVLIFTVLLVGSCAVRSACAASSASPFFVWTISLSTSESPRIVLPFNPNGGSIPTITGWSCKYSAVKATGKDGDREEMVMLKCRRGMESGAVVTAIARCDESGIQDAARITVGDTMWDQISIRCSAK